MRFIPHSLTDVIARTVLVMAVFLAGTLHVQAQEPDKRHVTPVMPATNRVKPPPKGTDEEVIQQYISGDSAAAVAQLRKDSLRRVYKHYPLLTDLSIGVNFAEPLFMAFGQSYASADVNATLNMWNRLQPTLELGLGWAKTHPNDMSFTYKGKPSPYFKVGANYNFLFKNSPDYQAVVGIRLGYSNFGYDVQDAYWDNGEWHEQAGNSITGSHSHAWWAEAGVGLKVRLFKNWSMGWMIRYHSILGEGKKDSPKPCFIPGYGLRDKSLGFSLGVFYTFNMGK